jgi:hypothetical protein
MDQAELQHRLAEPVVVQARQVLLVFLLLGIVAVLVVD